MENVGHSIGAYTIFINSEQFIANASALRLCTIKEFMAHMNASISTCKGKTLLRKLIDLNNGVSEVPCMQYQPRLEKIPDSFHEPSISSNHWGSYVYAGESTCSCSSVSIMTILRFLPHLWKLVKKSETRQQRKKLIVSSFQDVPNNLRSFLNFFWDSWEEIIEV